MADDASSADRLAVASSLLLQAPPGEVNDVFSDLRPVVRDDAELESGLLPALSLYNTQQFSLVELPDTRLPAMICSAARITGSSIDNRYFDPRSSQAFTFDHLRLCATNIDKLTPPSDDNEKFRSELDKKLELYVKDHFPSAVSSVFTVGASDSKESQKLTGEAKKAEDSDLVSSSESANGDQATGQTELDAEGPVGDHPEPAADSTQVNENHPEQKLESSKKFQIYIAGSKYNPTNYWTGRWRSFYEVDLDAARIQGRIQVNVHYYEQGNVQLSTNHEPVIELPDQDVDQIVKSIKKIENQFESSLNLAYLKLGDGTFKALRRTLPITKQKINWNQINSRVVLNDNKN